MSNAHPPLSRHHKQQPSQFPYLPPPSQNNVVGGAAGGAHPPNNTINTHGNAAARPPRHRNPRAVFSLCLRLSLAAVCALIAWQALASALWVSARVTLARGYLADVRDITDLAARGWRRGQCGGGGNTNSPIWTVFFLLLFRRGDRVEGGN